MFKTALAATLLLPAAAHAQDRDLPAVRYPALATHAATGPGFTPRGWTLEQSQRGDLNGDGLPDLALAFHQADPRNIVRNKSGVCGDTVDTNPRILAIAFADRRGGYTLAVQNHSLVPRHDDACALDGFAEPDGGLAITRGTLRIYLYSLMSAGGWNTGTTTFTFRWQQGALHLIGYDTGSLQRNTGEMATLSINYLTHKVRIAHGTADSDKERVRWSTVPAGAPPTIDQVGDGTEFDPHGLVSGL